MTGRPLCPQCSNPVDVLRPSPTPPDKGWAQRGYDQALTEAHVVAAYPCGCWLIPITAVILRALHRASQAMAVPAPEGAAA